uniref:Uncharacterized protein n=1 Tax=Rhizophora mucronata TaxID=61149 RepID=A0A2P2QDD0_RHIMU
MREDCLPRAVWSYV